ncbi:MAG TPA: isoprenylcysteine carboxylmethyltransferase family protein, partial [Candidatus Margulisiibacteriota bacterium]|nr:isoprenylcysteine carboxylmethyltransferase family protein [Candidatus Margulisiibacteriota bacterium]
VGLGVARAAVLYVRGVHVVAIDWQRSLWEQLADALAIVVILSWAYEAVAYSWPLRGHILPAWLAPIVVDSTVVKILGMMAACAGLLIFALALWAFADSWRIGIDRNTAGALVTRGIFAWTRNPIYIALDLIAFGTFLLQGRAIFLVLTLALAGLLHYQIVREERYLAGAYGDAYRAYCAGVGRYLPKIDTSAARATPSGRG